MKHLGNAPQKILDTPVHVRDTCPCRHSVWLPGMTHSYHSWEWEVQVAGASANRFTATTLETPKACLVQFQNKRKTNTPCGELLWVLETGWFKESLLLDWTWALMKTCYSSLFPSEQLQRVSLFQHVDRNISSWNICQITPEASLTCIEATQTDNAIHRSRWD